MICSAAGFIKLIRTKSHKKGMSHITKDHYVVERAKEVDSKVYFARHSHALEDQLYRLPEARPADVRASDALPLRQASSTDESLHEQAVMPRSLSQTSSILSDAPGWCLSTPS